MVTDDQVSQSPKEGSPIHPNPCFLTAKPDCWPLAVAPKGRGIVLGLQLAETHSLTGTLCCLVQWRDFFEGSCSSKNLLNSPSLLKPSPFLSVVESFPSPSKLCSHAGDIPVNQILFSDSRERLSKSKNVTALKRSERGKNYFYVQQKLHKCKIFRILFCKV